MDLLDLLDIGMQIVKALEIVHESGNTHNDLKLDNIMITDGKDQNVVLIDYGLVTQFLESDGNHLEKRVSEYFKGNYMFASLDQLNTFSPSRRSDLNSLCYILIYMVNGLKMPILDLTADGKNTPNQSYNVIKKFK